MPNSNPEFTDVVHAWQQADVNAIHPLRATDEDAYWKSGHAQAFDAARWLTPGARVVDFGCGDGRVAIPLDELGYDVTAVDASPAMLDRLYARYPMSVLLSDGLDLEGRIEPVDAIVARAVLIHHSHDDVERLVQALARVLKFGGLFIADWPTGPHHVRRDWIDVTTWEPGHRLQVAELAGLDLVEDATPSVWQRTS